MSEDDFLHYILPSFRLTVYVTKRTAVVAGRVKIGPWIFDSKGDNKSQRADKRGKESESESEKDKGKENKEGNKNDKEKESGSERVPHRKGFNASSLIILDRMGSGQLGASFTACLTSAASQLSTTFSFSHYSSRPLNLTRVILPAISPSLSTLSSHPTVRDLQLFNRDFHSKLDRTYDEKYEQALLLDTLSFLESINVISFWYPPEGMSGVFDELLGGVSTGRYPTASYVPAVRVVPTSAHSPGEYLYY